MTLKFIFVTPRQLIERGTEGKEMKEIRVNLYVPPSSNSASSTKYDLIGHKEDFRVNMQFALGTAMIGEGIIYKGLITSNFSDPIVLVANFCTNCPIMTAF